LQVLYSFIAPQNAYVSDRHINPIGQQILITYKHNQEVRMNYAKNPFELGTDSKRF